MACRRAVGLYTSQPTRKPKAAIIKIGQRTPPGQFVIVAAAAQAAARATPNSGRPNRPSQLRLRMIVFSAMRSHGSGMNSAAEANEYAPVAQRRTVGHVSRGRMGCHSHSAGARLSSSPCVMELHQSPSTPPHRLLWNGEAPCQDRLGEQWPGARRQTAITGSVPEWMRSRLCSCWPCHTVARVHRSWSNRILWRLTGSPASLRKDSVSVPSHQSMSAVPKFAAPYTAPSRLGPGSRLAANT